MHRFPRRFQRTAGATAIAAALLTPATASAAQGYVVTLAPAGDSTCAATIQAVSSAYSVTPRFSYTNALCGFSASISKRTVEQLRHDPRVASVEPDAAAGSF